MRPRIALAVRKTNVARFTRAHVSDWIPSEEWSGQARKLRLTAFVTVT